VHVISYCLATLFALSFAHGAVSASPQQATEIGLLTCGFAKGDPGLLQQVYAADPATNPGHPPALIGEANRSLVLVLQPFADSQSPALIEGKAQTTAAVVVVVSLTLRSAPA
jgi:hypothetical protein